MGVKGLWRLLMPIGRRISIETLAGKILAIDASIWMTQFLKAMRDPDTGNVRPAAHLIGFFRRLCKLRFQGIRPVLVFDGATPEIKQRELRERRKRREQLSVHGQDQTIDTVQRMAKRLLIQQLKKKGSMGVVGALKNSNTTSSSADVAASATSATITNTAAIGEMASFAPGFYDPEMEEGEQNGQRPKDGPSSKFDFEKQESNPHAMALRKNSCQSVLPQVVGKKKALPTSDTQEKLATSEEERKAEVELVEILQDDDYLHSPTRQSNEQNDWDTAIVDTANAANALSSAASCVGKAPKPQETITLPRNQSNVDGAVTTLLQNDLTKSRAQNQKTRRRGKKTTGKYKTGILNQSSVEEDFDIEYVASLPSTERKDLVEGAQRNRRIQSRREFMKVAYDPVGLSKCQLRNFLKSSRLNQEIHQMARQAVLAQEELAEESQMRVGSTARALHGNKKIIFETCDNRKVDKLLKKPSTTKDHMFRKCGGAGMKSSVMSKRQSIMAPSSEGTSDDEIQWDDGTELDRKMSVKEKENFGLVSKRRAIVDIESTDSENETISGGFIPETMPTLANGLKVSKSETMRDEGLPFITQNEKMAQELEDENLARALQAVEDDNSSFEGGFIPCFSKKVDRSSGATQVKEGEMAEMFDNEVVNEEAKCNFLDFRKGDNINEQFIHQATDEAIEGDRLADALQNSISGEAAIPCEETSNEVIYRSSRRQEDTITANMYQPMAPDFNRFNNEAETEAETETEDDIDWEDGEESTSDDPSMVIRLEKDRSENVPELKASHEGNKILELQKTPVSGENLDGDQHLQDTKLEKTALKARVTTHEFAANQPSFHGARSKGKEKLNAEVGLSTNDEENVASELLEGDNPFQEVFPAASSSTHSDMVAALEHAQATAANLTNWAGRAFRRAVAQHAEESGLKVPDSAKPRILEQPERIGTATLEFFDKTKTSEATAGQGAEQRHENRHNDFVTRTIHQSPDENRGRKMSTWPETLPTEDAQQTIQAYQEQWEKERNQEERDLDTVTDEMRADVIQLLQLFGIPYVESPAEAEAQCVTLERLGLVDGIVTEDSDAFVFGGRRIYKNIFDDQKYVEVYDAKDAESEMNLTHDGLVALAMLLGGDYTEGVKGVGIVNGMEIVDAFDVSSDLKAGLSAFRQWLDGFDPSDVLGNANAKEAMNKEQIFHLKHHNARTRWIAPKYFPDPKVLTAYLNPVVDTSEERFSWGLPDMERLILFCNKHVGWSPEETRHLLQPVADAIESKGSIHQTRIDSFMRYEHGIKFADVRSKRLRDVLKSAQKDNMERAEVPKKRKKQE